STERLFAKTLGIPPEQVAVGQVRAEPIDLPQEFVLRAAPARPPRQRFHDQRRQVVGAVQRAVLSAQVAAADAAETLFDDPGTPALFPRDLIRDRLGELFDTIGSRHGNQSFPWLISDGVDVPATAHVDRNEPGVACLRAGLASL